VKILSNLDLSKNQLLNAVLQNLATDPSTPLEGQFYYSTASHALMFYNGTAWKNASGMTAAEILTALLTVDGTTSGLDADLLDGQHGSYYVGLSSTAETNAKTYADGLISNLIASAPGVLDTLNELAAALGDDPNFATTIAAAIAAKTGKYSVSVGNGTLTEITVTHNLNTTDVTLSLREVAAPYNGVITDWQVVDANNIKLIFAVAPTSNQYRVVVVR
jgi:hypothetical protein